jgi:hypothetical protein
MSNDLYITFLEKCLGKSPDDGEILALSGSEVVEAMWPLNDKFKPYLHRIAALPYDARFEQEADDAIEALVFKSSDWNDISAQAWRVLLERQQQALIFFQLQADEPLVPIPAELNPIHYSAAVWLFVLHQWSLPLPIADRSNLAMPANTIQGILTSH